MIWLVSLALLVTAATVLLSKMNKSTGSPDRLPVALRSFKLTNGWGYEILVDNKVYIHQDCIPAIASFKRFNTEAEALLIGNKVVDKIKHGHKPVMTVVEISNSHIHY
ncbi:MAG: DUF4907 domain-containing protein [Bacteroidota bacterium]